MRAQAWFLVGGVATTGVVLAAALTLQAKPIEVAASGYAVPQVASVANGQSMELMAAGPDFQPQDWTFAPSHEVTAAGTEGEVDGVATFFSGENFTPAFPSVLLPNADEGTATATVTYQGASVEVPVTVTPAPAADVANGKRLYDKNCAACHGPTAQGVGDFPNLTNTDAGIAGWTVAQFNRAVRVGVDDVGATLAPTMTRWQAMGFAGDSGQPPTAQEMSDLFGYLMTLQ